MYDWAFAYGSSARPVGGSSTPARSRPRRRLAPTTPPTVTGRLPPGTGCHRHEPANRRGGGAAGGAGRGRRRCVGRGRGARRGGPAAGHPRRQHPEASAPPTTLSRAGGGSRPGRHAGSAAARDVRMPRARLPIATAPNAPSTAPAATDVRSAARWPNVGSPASVRARTESTGSGAGPSISLERCAAVSPSASRALSRSLAAHAAAMSTTREIRLRKTNSAAGMATAPRVGLSAVPATSRVPNTWIRVRPTPPAMAPLRRPCHGRTTPGQQAQQQHDHPGVQGQLGDQPDEREHPALTAQPDEVRHPAGHRAATVEAADRQHDPEPDEHQDAEVAQFGDGEVPRRPSLVEHRPDAVAHRAQPPQPTPQEGADPDEGGDVEGPRAGHLEADDAVLVAGRLDEARQLVVDRPRGCRRSGPAGRAAPARRR